jgi:hypothetical protein
MGEGRSGSLGDEVEELGVGWLGVGVELEGGLL